MKNFKHPLFDEVKYFEKINSTNKKADQLIKSKQISGNFLLIAKNQSRGIGRKDNSWFSPEGGIWITAGLYGLDVQSNLTIFTGICIHKALLKLFSKMQNDLKIKWSNDLYLNEKKLCGILSSHLPAFKYHLIGIGINTNFSEFPTKLSDLSISIKQYLKTDIDNSNLVKTIFDIFSSNLPEFIEGKLQIEYFNEYSLLTGKKIELDTDFDKFSGICKGINKKGAILIELKKGMIQPFFAGTVINFLDMN